MTLASHTPDIIKTYGWVNSRLERYKIRYAWATIVVAVNTAHADEKPNKNVMSVNEDWSVTSVLYQGGMRSPPILLKRGVTNHRHVLPRVYNGVLCHEIYQKLGMERSERDGLP